jgi:hypothetical protein
MIVGELNCLITTLLYHTGVGEHRGIFPIFYRENGLSFDDKAAILELFTTPPGLAAG